MPSRYQANRWEMGCLILLWILSPLAALYVWFYARALLWVQSSTNDYLKANMEGAPISWSLWVSEWSHWWWLLLIGVITIPFLLMAYLWMLVSTGRIVCGAWKRR